MTDNDLHQNLHTQLSALLDPIPAPASPSSAVIGDGVAGSLPDETEDLMPAGVLVPLVTHRSGVTVLLTQRTEHLDKHAGQISFPGGRVEAHDADFAATAIRETEEEIGLPGHHIEVLGSFDECLTGTGFRIVPVVGLIRPGFELSLDPFEVSEAFEVPLEVFLNEDNHARRSAVFRGREREFYVVEYEHRYIWGATAAMLVNFARRWHGGGLKL